MIKIEAATRLMADQENHRWIQPVVQKQKMTPKPPASDRVKPETFNGSPETIANELKRVHKELAPAVAALNFYFNKFGKNIGADKKYKRDKAHEKLRQLFKVDNPKPTEKRDPAPKPKPVGTDPIGTDPIGK